MENKHKTNKIKIIKTLAALTAIVIAGVAFCCSKKEPAGNAANAGWETAALDDGQKNVRAESEEAAVTTVTETAKSAKTAETAEKTEIWVYVCGAVREPGVYSVPSGARVFEAVDLAGGMTEDALAGALNLASELSDGQKVYVPDSAHPVDPEAAADTAQNGAGGGKIDLNHASLSELMTLPGIGEVKAQAIISYRETQPFRTIEDIMQVSGIKENGFQKIRDLITVS